MLFKYIQVLESRDNNNNHISTFSSWLRNLLAKNGTYDNKEHEGVIPGSEQEEVVTTYWLYNKKYVKCLFSTGCSESSLINHYTSQGAWIV